jgi:hypothetical protein
MLLIIKKILILVSIFILKGSSKPDLNLFLKKQASNFEKILKDGIDVENFGRIKIKIIGCIQDTPAIAKVFNVNQFNGRFGCVNCFNAGVQLKGKKKRVYLHSKNTIIRRNQDYREHLKTLKELKKEGKLSKNGTYYGIKGPCWLSNYIRIPENIVLDYMHVTCIGTLEAILKLWLNQYRDNNNNKNLWYLGNIVYLIF